MARKVLDITIDADGRDKGKVFRLTEMPSSQAEKWGQRAMSAMARSGVQIPDQLMGSGMAGIGAIGLYSFMGIRAEEMQPLMDEMMACIKIVPDPSHPQIARTLIEDDIEEVKTRLKLRNDLYELQTGFSVADAIQKLIFPTAPAAPSPTTRTSPEPSAPSSPPASPA